MDPTALTTFSTVARHGSVSAAALDLHTVQSNVTTRLKQLEAELGVTLFTRHARGVTLTEPGTRLLAYAGRFSALEAEARAAVRDDGLARGSLRLGSMETTAAVRLPAVLGRFHRTHPGVQLEVRTGPTAELLELLLARRLDLALIAAPIDHPELVATPVFQEELVLVSARQSADISARLAHGGLTVIVFRQGCSYRQRLEAYFSARGWLPFQRLEFGTLEGMLGCVVADVGVTVLPRSALEHYRDHTRLQIEPLTTGSNNKRLSVETLLVRRADAYLSASVQGFYDAVDGEPAGMPKTLAKGNRSSVATRRLSTTTRRN
jgi:LysR family transcriptional regulator, cell division regulator